MPPLFRGITTLRRTAKEGTDVSNMFRFSGAKKDIKGRGAWVEETVGEGHRRRLAPEYNLDFQGSAYILLFFCQSTHSKE